MDSEEFEKLERLFEEKCVYLLNWLEFLFGPLDDPKTFPETGNEVSRIYIYDVNKTLDIERESRDRIFWVVDSPIYPWTGKLAFPTREAREMVLDFLSEDIALWEVLYLYKKHKDLFCPIS